MKRKVVRGYKDRKFFAKSANKTKAVNVVPTSSRGGIIM